MTDIYFCRAGQTSSVIKLCRHDKTTVDRYIAHRHGQLSKHNVIIKSFYDGDKTVANARECVLALKTKVDSPCLLDKLQRQLLLLLLYEIQAPVQSLGCINPDRENCYSQH